MIILTIAIGGLTEPFLFNTSFKNLVFLFMGQMLVYSSTKASRWKHIALFMKLNKTIKIKERKIIYIKPSKFQYLCGIAIALLTFVFIVVIVQQPKGYIVSRTDCGDLTKETHAYEEDAESYQDYKEMKSFLDVDLVEFFSGNIVKMELARKIYAGFAIGYCIGSSIAMIYLYCSKIRGKCV